MDILFLGEEGDFFQAISGRKDDGLSSFSFAASLPRLDEPVRFTAFVIAASRFIRECHPPWSRPVLASGPLSLISEAFESGCSDYLVEPWTLEELTARVRARTGSLPHVCGQILRIVDSVLSGPFGKVSLSPGIHDLMRLLMANSGFPLSREVISLALGLSAKASRAIDMRMVRLRNALMKVAGKDAALLLRSTPRGYILG